VIRVRVRAPLGHWAAATVTVTLRLPVAHYAGRGARAAERDNPSHRGDSGTVTRTPARCTVLTGVHAGGLEGRTLEREHPRGPRRGAPDSDPAG
jgi:hypothetical protein